MKRSATKSDVGFSLLHDLQRKINRLKIKQRIKAARDTAGLTQPELADLMEPPVHWRTVQEWESQQNENVPFDQLDRIAEVTKTTTVWILHGNGELWPTAAGEDEAEAARWDEVLRRLRRIEEALDIPQDAQAEPLPRRAANGGDGP